MTTYALFSNESNEGSADELEFIKFSNDLEYLKQYLEKSLKPNVRKDFSWSNLCFYSEDYEYCYYILEGVLLNEDGRIQLCTKFNNQTRIFEMLYAGEWIELNNFPFCPIRPPDCKPFFFNHFNSKTLNHP